LAIETLSPNERTSSPDAARTEGLRTGKGRRGRAVILPKVIPQRMDGLLARAVRRLAFRAFGLVPDVNQRSSTQDCAVSPFPPDDYTRTASGQLPSATTCFPGRIRKRPIHQANLEITDRVARSMFGVTNGHRQFITIPWNNWARSTSNQI
jgi:hypothetical protein